jgi:hypothetical protein
VFYEENLRGGRRDMHWWWWCGRWTDTSCAGAFC